MTDKNLTHILAILDRSGSMSSVRADTEGGFDSFIAEQQKVEGECYVTLVQFDDRYEVVYTNKAVGYVPPLNLIPRGSTALLDAIGRAVNAKGAELAALPENRRPGSVIVLVLTDGWENASREFSASTIKALLTKQQEQYSWDFIFMGSNQDAVLTGQEYGFKTTNSLTYTGENTRVAFASAANNVSTYRGAVAQGASYSSALASAAFTDEDRAEAVGESAE